MFSILKKLFLFICMYGWVHYAQAQAPVKRLAPARPFMPAKNSIKPPQKGYWEYVAELQKRRREQNMPVRTSPNFAQARSKVASRYPNDRTAAVDALTQAYHQRLLQRFPKMQLQQQRKGFRTLSARPAMSYSQIADAQREHALKRIEQVRRREYK